MSRLHSMSDDDRVLSGEREPAVPLSILVNRRVNFDVTLQNGDTGEVTRGRHPSAGSETWHTFVVRRSPDQEAVEKYVAMLEAQVGDLRDAINMTDPDDLDEGGWRLLDRLESAHVALGFAARELRDLL